MIAKVSAFSVEAFNDHPFLSAKPFGKIILVEKD
jgi:hypothetical protein